jgi:hypothetical protein
VWNQPLDLPLSATVPRTDAGAGVEHDARHRTSVAGGHDLRPLTADS